jgi:hypothetical protein
VTVRPTLSEQLRGLSHILEHVVAPDVQSDYAQQTLIGVIRAMEMLTRQAATAGPFLAWDNEQTRALLGSIANHVPLGVALDPASPIAPGDLVALDAENERLRALLSAVIPAVAADVGLDQLPQAIVAHLRERITRYPYASTGSLPSR